MSLGVRSLECRDRICNNLWTLLMCTTIISYFMSSTKCMEISTTINNFLFWSYLLLLSLYCTYMYHIKYAHEGIKYATFPQINAISFLKKKTFCIIFILSRWYHICLEIENIGYCLWTVIIEAYCKYLLTKVLNLLIMINKDLHCISSDKSSSWVLPISNA